MESPIQLKNKPYFSVLIPTKGRSHLVGFAIRSVLEQTFRDYEVIVIDNDDGEQTANTVSQIKDERLHYFRTGGLNMSDNWEYALEQARGHFVTILEDKQAYYPFALQRIYDQTIDSDAEVIVWSWDLYENKKDRVIITHPVATQNQTMTSEQVVDAYIESPRQSWKYLPRMLNSCARLSLIRDIKTRTNYKFFSEVAPDLCAAFQLLSVTERVSMLNMAVGMVGYIDLSNAKKIKDKVGGYQYYGAGDIAQESVRYVQIKKPWLIHNTVYSDYLRIRERLDGCLKQRQMTSDQYFKLCLSDMADKSVANLFDLKDWYDLVLFAKAQRLSILTNLLEFAKCLIRRLVSPILRRRQVVDLRGCANILEAVRKQPAFDRL